MADTRSSQGQVIPLAKQQHFDVIRPGNADAAIALIRKSGRTVVTFAGFSGAGYEEPAAVERAIAKVLDALSPASADLRGATRKELASYTRWQKRGFTTIGVVSAIAEKEGAKFSPMSTRFS